jgi:hypothetical protein
METTVPVNERPKAGSATVGRVSTACEQPASKRQPNARKVDGLPMAPVKILFIFRILQQTVTLQN